MSDRVLDMQARLQGARQVERELLGLEAAAKKVETATQPAASETRSLSSALGASNEAATGAIKSTEKLFSVTDALAGVVGKALGVIGLFNLAWDVGAAIYEKAAGAQEELAGAVEAATGKVKAQAAAIETVVNAAERLAQAGGLDLAELTAEERREARARDLERVENKERLTRLLAQEDDLERRVARARAAGGVSAVEGERRALGDQVERLAFRQRELDLIDATVQAEARRREGLNTTTPTAPTGGGGPQSQVDILAGLPELQTEFAARIGKMLGPAEGLGIFGPDLFDQASAGLAAVNDVVGQAITQGNAYVGTLYAQAQGLQAVRAAAAQGRAVALGYAEAQGKAAAAAALTAALRGESVAEAVNAVLQGVAVESTVQAGFEFAKGVAASATPITAPQAAAHFAASKLFLATAALAGVGAAATGGFGSGSAPSSPADVSAPSGPRGAGAFGRERDQDRGGFTIINNMDLRSRPLATNRELQREMAREFNDLARVPGGPRLDGSLVRRGGGY